MLFKDTHLLNVGGRLRAIAEPQVMAIINVTPDSFYAPSRIETERALRERVRTALAEGATMLDIGACSTRPASSPASEAEEMARLRWALPIVMAEGGGAVVSVDSFRADVARMAVEEYGVHIINDIAGGEESMIGMVARLGIPYVLTYGGSGPMMEDGGAFAWLGRKIEHLRGLGIGDIIVDPGFGFNKTVAENWTLLRDLDALDELGLPILVGVSRKRMVYEALGTTAAGALNGTTATHAWALAKARNVKILRVHDVREAAQTVELWKQWSDDSV